MAWGGVERLGCPQGPKGSCCGLANDIRPIFGLSLLPQEQWWNGTHDTCSEHGSGLSEKVFFTFFISHYVCESLEVAPSISVYCSKAQPKSRRGEAPSGSAPERGRLW